MFVDVALNLPLPTTFTWSVPPALAPMAQRGHRVLVPFRHKIEVGVVIRTHAERPEGLQRVRAISDVLDHERFLPEPLLALTEWIASYYHANIGESVHLAVPSALAPPSGEVRYRRTDAAPSMALRPLTPLATTLLAHLEAKGPESFDQLRAHLAEHHQLTVHRADLDLLEEAGLVQLEEATSSRKIRTDLHLHRTETPREGRIGDKQKQVLDFLETHGDSWFSELRDLYGLSRATIRPLIERDLVTSEEVSLEYDPFGNAPRERRHEDPALTDDQQHALDAIAGALHENLPTTFLLHGVTGSGKTEVYLRAIRAARKQGKRALVLLPEIALTPQFIGVIRAALDEELAVLHSALTPAQRRSQWSRIRRGEIGVVVGARSSLFSPMESLGLIIVDEEHDPSFKQHEGVRYNARDAALVLARSCNAVTVLGSATPSMETLFNARNDRYTTLSMPKRVANRPLPHIELIDLKNTPVEGREHGGVAISDMLFDGLRQTIDAGEQAILFLNRRGFAPEVQCSHCAETLECPACERPMTFHHRGNVVACHHCGHTRPLPRQCPTCQENALEPMGAGTERLEQLIETRLEGFRVGRLDRDISKARAMEKVLQDFRRGSLDVLVGTQMVTKGHDFPRVTFVGVLSGDQSLTFADFRSGERTWQLLTQVAGRAGRGDRPGRVMIQSWKPEHPVLQAVVRHDFEAMAAWELRGRQREGYPPFGHVVLLRFQGPDYAALSTTIQAIFRWLVANADPTVRFVPPIDAPIPRVRDRFRMQILVRASQRKPLHDLLTGFRAKYENEIDSADRKGVKWSIDVDPQSLM